MHRLEIAFSRFVRTVGWHRRLLAAGLAAGAVALTLQAAESDPAPTVPVVAAAGELRGGTTLTPEDLLLVDIPRGAVPRGAVASVDDAVGRLLSGPMHAGELVTDLRLVGPSLLAGWGEDLVATPVRIADPGVLVLVRPGDRIDLYATPLSALGPAAVVSAKVPVLAVPDSGEQGVLAEGALLVIAATTRQAGLLAEAAVTSRLSVVLRTT
jgi:Flp pilus assembly protein CpaB